MRPFPEPVARSFKEAGVWGEESIAVRFEANARSFPERVALVDPPNREMLTEGLARQLCYGETLQAVDNLASAFLADGLRAGDIVLVQMPNIHELAIVYLAAASIGLVISPIPVQYRRHELNAIVRLVSPKAFCTVARFGKHRLAEQFLEGTPFDGLVYALGANIPEGTHDLSQAMARKGEPFERNADADSLFTVSWTSGTEGVPKAVPKTHNNWLCSLASSSDASGLTDGDAILAPFPFVNAASIGGLLMPWLRVAGTLVLHHPFDLGVFLEQIESHKVAYTVVAPALISSIIHNEEVDRVAKALASLRSVGTGSAPPDPAHVAAFERRFNIGVLNIFGSNEGIQLASSRSAVPDPVVRSRLFPRNGDISWLSDERTSNGCRFKLVSLETGERLSEPGRSGEMRISGPSVFPGYFREGTYDRSSFDDEGFFRTGDLFEIVEINGQNSFIRFVGRSKEIIVRGGMKIAPAEIDAVLAGHPDVAEAAAVAYSDERLGERVCAVVVPKAGRQIELQALTSLCEATGLAPFKWPDRLLLVDSLPRNPLAKVQRNKLREMVENEDRLATRKIA